MTLYKVTSVSKDGHTHEWNVRSKSKSDAIAVTLHLLNVTKGWSQYQYTVKSVKKITDKDTHQPIQQSYYDEH